MSPITYLLSLIYFSLLVLVFSVSNFYYFWVYTELLMLVFIGISFTLFSNSFSQLMVYFIIQTLASFILMVSYILSLPELFIVGAFINLSMFPFHLWFIVVVSAFPNMLLWLVMTLHKIPVLLILQVFVPLQSYAIVWLSIIFSFLISGVLMLTILSIRDVLVVSSIGNNSWFLLSQITGSDVMLTYVLLYSAILFLVFSVSYSTNLVFSRYYLVFCVILISGIPPFPLFFTNMFVISSVFQFSFSVIYFSLTLLVAFLLVVGYLSYAFKLMFLVNGSFPQLSLDT